MPRIDRQPDEAASEPSYGSTAFWIAQPAMRSFEWKFREDLSSSKESNRSLMMDENRLLQTLRNLSTDLCYLRQMLSVAGRHSGELAAIADRVERDADAVADTIRSSE